MLMHFITTNIPTKILYAIGYGIYRYHQRKVIENDHGVLSIIAKTTMDVKSRKIFIVTFIVYGMFFSLTAGLIVYQPDIIFSYHYDAIVPSAHMNACCGDPGYMPTIIVYLTEHVGLQIIPINLVLVLTVSYLAFISTLSCLPMYFPYSHSTTKLPLIIDKCCAKSFVNSLPYLQS